MRGQQPENLQLQSLGDLQSETRDICGERLLMRRSSVSDDQYLNLLPAKDGRLSLFSPHSQKNALTLISSLTYRLRNTDRRVSLLASNRLEPSRVMSGRAKEDLCGYKIFIKPREKVQVEVGHSAQTVQPRGDNTTVKAWNRIKQLKGMRDFVEDDGIYRLERTSSTGAANTDGMLYTLYVEYVTFLVGVGLLCTVSSQDFTSADAGWLRFAPSPFVVNTCRQPGPPPGLMNVLEDLRHKGWLRQRIEMSDQCPCHGKIIGWHYSKEVSAQDCPIQTGGFLSKVLKH